MKVAISNIAWEVDQDKEVLSLLDQHRVLGVEIAPTKIWKEPLKVSLAEVTGYSKFWKTRNKQIVATQSLLFGRSDLQIFQGKALREETKAYLTKMLEITAALGATVAVFGSPKNRLVGNLKKGEVEKIAQDFFFNMGEVAEKNDLFFCIEPNPTAYGADFVTNTEEGTALVSMVNQSNFRLHLDSGVMMVNNEKFEDSINDGFPFLKHFHVSEPNLQPVGSKQEEHKKISAELKNLNYNNWVSIEMRNGGEGNLAVIDKTLQFVTDIYGEE